MRISVSCSRAALVSFRASSSSRSVVHRPSFGSGWTSRSYARDVSPDRSILRTVFRDTRRSRAICLIVLPLTKCSRRIRPIVSTVSIPPPPASNQSEQRIRPNWRGSILDADNPLQGVKIARRITRWTAHFGVRTRNVLIIAGLGFDPRAVSVSQELINAGGEDKRELWLLCYDNGQQTTDAQRQTVANNDAGFQNLFSSPRSIMRLPIAMRTDRARSATCQNTKSAIYRPKELLGYDDVIVDISALPRMISLMTVPQLLTLFDDRQAKATTSPNLHSVAG